jgi:hypothetical protein
VFSLLAGPFVFLHIGRTFFYICISTYDWPEPLHYFYFFLFLLIFEVIGFVVVWIIYWVICWIVKGFYDDKPKDEQKQ